MRVTLLFSGGRNMGVEYIAACLKRSGNEVKLIYDPVLFLGSGVDLLRNTFDYKDIVVPQVLSSNPDIIGISSFTDSYGWACARAQELKQKSNVPIVIGGLHATAVPDIIIKERFFDYVCVGEGEQAMVDLVDALEKCKDTLSIPNIWTKKDGKIIANPPRVLLKDLDSLPFPVEGAKCSPYKDFRSYSGHYSVITGRGCPYKCTFCSNSLMLNVYSGKGTYLRRRSVDNVIKELIYVKDEFNVNTFSFEDDIFTFNFNWLKEFCEKYSSQVNLPFSCQVHGQFVDKEVVKLLESSNCINVCLGIQALDPYIRKEILHREGTPEQIETAVKLFKNSKISIAVDIILSLPGENEEQLVDMAKAINKYGPDMVLAFWFRPYPRTEIVRIANERGFLNNEEVKYIEENKDYIPYVMGTRIFYKKSISLLICLLLISADLPLSVLNFILDNKLYRFRLPFLNVLCHIYSMLISVYKKICWGKKRFFYFTPLGIAKFYFFSIFRLQIKKFSFLFARRK